MSDTAVEIVSVPVVRQILAEVMSGRDKTLPWSDPERGLETFRAYTTALDGLSDTAPATEVRDRIVAVYREYGHCFILGEIAEMLRVREYAVPSPDQDTSGYQVSCAYARCGKPFTPSRPSNRFCSESCRQGNYQLRKRAAAAEAANAGYAVIRDTRRTGA